MVNIYAANVDFSFKVGQATRNDFHGSGFSGAVGTEKTADFSFFQIETDLIEGFLFAILFTDIGEGDSHSDE